MIRLLLTAVALMYMGIMAPLSAQTIEDFRYLNDPIQNESFISVGLNRIKMTNNAAPYPENHSLGVFNLYLDLRSYKLERGQSSLVYSNPLVTDLILLLRDIFDNPNNIYRKEGSSLSSGPLGWLNLGWNLSGPGKIQPLLGFHHHDYFLSSTYVPDSTQPSERFSQEPQGYYFSAGPMGGLRMAAGSFAQVEVRGMYGFSYWRAVSLSYAEEDNSYPKPHWLHLQADILTKWGLFGSLQHHRLINRGDLPNATRRWEAVLGFQFML